MAARSEHYKYILKTDAEDEFYDLESDPLEKRNLTAGGLSRERAPDGVAGA